MISYDGIIIFSTSLIIRLLFVFLGSYIDGLSMDSNWSIYYTDIDYSVLTDGSAFMSSFSSPYERSTYRYPPLLALLLIPNGYMSSFGKILFSLFDSMISYEIYVINNIKHKNKESNNTTKHETAGRDSGLYTGIFSWIWVVNVISINICTRGSFDSLNNYLLVLIIRLCYQFRSTSVVDSSVCGSTRHVAVIGSLLGLLIYFRLYPIIYLPACMVYMMNRSSNSSSSSSSSRSSSSRSQLDDNGNRSNNMRGDTKSSDGSRHINTTGASISPTTSRKIDFINSSKYSKVSDYNTGDDASVNPNPKKRSIDAVVHSSNPSNNIISKIYRSDSSTHDSNTYVDQQGTVSNDDEGIVMASSSSYSFNEIKHSMVLAAFTAMTLLLLVAMSYHIYGREYLHNAILYHLDRTDHRHNFSIHFYWTYLKQALTDRHNVFYEMLDVNVAKQYWPFNVDSLSLVAPHGISSYLYLSSVLFFLPQLLLSIVVIYKVIDIDLSLCLLLLTLIFVAYNKVVTAQYFTWYICLLPTSLTSLTSTSLMKLGQALFCWVLCCLLWLFTAYGLEFNGRNSDAAVAVDAVAELLSDVYATVWLSSVLFHAMLQRLFIHANVEAEMHKRDSIIGHHDFTNPSNMDDNNTKSKHSGLKVIIIAATLYFIWIWVGIIFYKYHSNWTLGTAYYYAMEAGLSIGFCEPSEVDDWSRLFTIFYVLLASSLISGSIGAVTSKLLSTRAVLIPTRNREVLFVDSTTMRMTITSVCTKLWYELKVCVGWYSHRSRVISFIVFIIWMGIGTVYGMLMERWTFITSLYWSVTSCSTGGLQSATCLHGTSGTTCDMGTLRGGLMGTYFLFGVPIYANCLGQFAMMAIQRAVLEDRMNKLKQPIDDNEFMYCANILSPAGSDTLNCGEYILLELMRLRACNANQIESLKANFNRIDKHQTGFITMEELRQVGKVVTPKYRSAVGRVRTMSIEFIDNFIASPSRKLFQFGSQPSEGEAEVDGDVDNRDRVMQQQEIDEEVMMHSNESTKSHSIKSTVALKESNTVMNNNNSPGDYCHSQLSVLDDDDEMEEKSTSQ